MPPLSAYSPYASGPPEPSRRGRNLMIFGFAALVAIVLLPFTLQHQRERIPPIEQRSWTMRDLTNITQPAALKRFGRPFAARDYQLTEGSFIGPRTGLKHFYPLNSPGYEERFRVRNAVAWTFPQFAAVREVVWKLPDSTLTIWFHQPRGEVDFHDGDTAELRMPLTPPEEWVALDNYRIGKDVPAESAAR